MVAVETPFIAASDLQRDGSPELRREPPWRVGRPVRLDAAADAIDFRMCGHGLRRREHPVWRRAEIVVEEGEDRARAAVIPRLRAFDAPRTGS